MSNWSKLKNSKYRSRRFSADDIPHVKLSNRFSVINVDQQSTGFLKHVENKVTPLAGKTKSQKGRFYYLEVVMRQNWTHAPAKLDPCSSKIGPMLQECLGSEYEITSILKSIAPLANVTEDVGKPGNDLTK